MYVDRSRLCLVGVCLSEAQSVYLSARRPSSAVVDALRSLDMIENDVVLRRISETYEGIDAEIRTACIDGKVIGSFLLE